MDNLSKYHWLSNGVKCVYRILNSAYFIFKVGLLGIRTHDRVRKTYKLLLLRQSVPSIPNHLAQVLVLIRKHSFKYWDLLSKEKVVSSSIRTWCIWILFKHLLLSWAFAPWPTSFWFTSRYSNFCTNCLFVGRNSGMLWSPVCRWHMIKDALQLFWTYCHRYKVALVKLSFNAPSFNMTNWLGWIQNCKCTKKSPNEWLHKYITKTNKLQISCSNL